MLVLFGSLRKTVISPFLHPVSHQMIYFNQYTAKLKPPFYYQPSGTACSKALKPIPRLCCSTHTIFMLIVPVWQQIIKNSSTANEINAGGGLLKLSVCQVQWQNTGLLFRNALHIALVPSAWEQGAMLSLSSICEHIGIKRKHKGHFWRMCLSIHVQTRTHPFSAVLTWQM